MSFSHYRYSGDFEAIQRMAGACKIAADKYSEIIKAANKSGYADAVDGAMLIGASEALYALAPQIREPNENNIIDMVLYPGTDEED